MLLPDKLIQRPRSHPHGQRCVSSHRLGVAGLIAFKQPVGHCG